MRMSETRRLAMPLDKLPDATQERIAEQVAAPAPPPRWWPVGAPDSRHPMAWLESRGWWEWHWQRGIDPALKREPLPFGMREKVIDRDGLVCQLCGGDVEPSDIHIDHIKPYSKGGRHVLENLQVAHSACNLRKGAKEV